MRPEALREWRVRALRDSTPAAAKCRAVDRRDRASGANTIKSIDRMNVCRSNLWSFWSTVLGHGMPCPQRQHAWVRGRFGSATAGHCGASPARLGARASRPHAAMRLDVNPLIGRERHGARASRPHAAMRLDVNLLIGGERHGARASRPHAAMRLDVNPLIGGERHGARASRPRAAMRPITGARASCPRPPRRGGSVATSADGEQTSAVYASCSARCDRNPRT